MAEEGEVARVLVALGGNALSRPSERGTMAGQLASVRRSSGYIAEMIAAGNEVVISHGNGPQVGNILLQNELARESVASMPLDACGAESEGLIGYMIQQSLGNELRRRGLRHEVVTVVTQTVVDPDDPAFVRPTKPVGGFVTAEEALRRIRESGEAWAEDSGRGWRRVVPSPKPLAIVEAPTIAKLLALGTVVVAAGGGGVPVYYRDDSELAGVEAVIDKDLAAARLAQQLAVQVLLILTDVAGVALAYGRPEQRFLGDVTLGELEGLFRRGEFPAGSMGPKVVAAIGFLRNGGDRAVICSLDDALAGLAGEAGTQIRRDNLRSRAASAA
ncbi:MAG: carbamate kinase [Chloroflexi bacterium]|nr:carbamate kinase [Chloroflexota bacterium]MCL5110166.1 carbamate kinase [Chloroflexota bacterium]